MTDRRRRRHEATKAEILRAAWDLMERDGVGGLTMAELASALDMAPQSLYGYFSSKDAVYDALFREGNDALRERMTAPLRAGDPLGLVREFVDRYLDFCLEQPARFQLLFQRPVPGFEPSPESMAIAGEVLTWAVDALAQAGIGDMELVLIALGALSGIVNYQIANRLPEELIRALAHRALGIFLAGIQAERGGEG